MEEHKDDCQSNADSDSMQDLTWWGITERYTGGAGQWLEKSWNHRFKGYSWENFMSSWIQIMHWTEGSPARVATCPGLSEVCQSPFGWCRGNTVKVTCSDGTKVEVFGLNSTRYGEAWGWKHDALRELFRTTEVYQATFCAATSSLSQRVKNGLWLVLPTWQWRKPHSQEGWIK